MTHRHACLDALRWKVFRNYYQGRGKAFTFHCNVSSAEEKRADKLPSQLLFWAFRALGVSYKRSLQR